MNIKLVRLKGLDRGQGSVLCGRLLGALLVTTEAPAAISLSSAMQTGRQAASCTFAGSVLLSSCSATFTGPVALF